MFLEFFEENANTVFVFIILYFYIFEITQFKYVFSVKKIVLLDKCRMIKNRVQETHVKITF